jgi:hypothetical protein
MLMKNGNQSIQIQPLVKKQTCINGSSAGVNTESSLITGMV